MMCGNNNNGCGLCGFNCGNLWWIILLVLLFGNCGGGYPCGGQCGCDNGGCGCC